MFELNVNIDNQAATDRLMRFLSVEGVTGEEKAIGQTVAAELHALGVPRRAIRLDDANKRIPWPTQTGNLIVNLPGTRPGKRLMFSTHLDTVPLAAGARPVRKGKRIVAAGPTALGGDNRTGVACLVTLAGTLIEQSLPHPPITLLFTVREESGLWGARCVDRAMLGNPACGFNVDGNSPTDVILGAVGAIRWEAEIRGLASHAGAHPEQGVSASLVAALALADVHRGGWFGKIERGGRTGTSNIGSIGDAAGHSAGTASNVVTDFAMVKGEARSHDARFVKEITLAYRQAFRKAAAGVRNDRGRAARLKFRARLDYLPFKLKPDAAAVRSAAAAIRAIGLEPSLRTTNGGLDANWLCRLGIPTVTIGAGQNNIHAIGEFIDLEAFHCACRVLIALATMAPAIESRR